MKLGSLFDGIGGWPLAAIHARVTPVWASEIDAFPATVTAHHFPQVKQLGDITKIDVDKLEPVDIICAGSPCQDLSVAGKREGLTGERSGLFRTAIKLVHRLRERTGKPRYFVWENVPGAFSSNKGLDFRAVLEEISQTEIPVPSGGKWAESGMVEWGGGSLAWRVLDAQYWGVPQRRKRIFLVADFAGQSAGEILFESQGVSRDSAESQGEGEETATDIGTSIDSAIGVDIYNIDGKAAALYGGTGQGTLNGAIFDTRKVVYSFDSLASNSMKSKNPHSGCRQVEVSKTLDTTIPDLSKNQGGIAIYDMTHADEVMRPVTGDKSNCLNSRMGTGGNQVPVIHTIAGNIIGRDNKNGGNQLGIGQNVSPTLNTVDRHAVATVGNNSAYMKTVGSLCARDYKGVENQFVNEGKCIIDTIKGKVYSMGHDQRASTYPCEKADALMASDYKQPPIANDTFKTVRRLTPTECERLQGLPDGYTDVEYNGKPAPDSKRYKALGNGMAQPCADFVIRRIQEVNK